VIDGVPGEVLLALGAKDQTTFAFWFSIHGSGHEFFPLVSTLGQNQVNPNTSPETNARTGFGSGVLPFEAWRDETFLCLPRWQKTPPSVRLSEAYPLRVSRLQPLNEAAQTLL
jgi:hypothetical protein